MRVLALDHGGARCGCAVSDPTETIVTPLTAIADPDSTAGLSALKALIAEQRPDAVVVGLPLLTSGREGAQAAAARSFAGRLRAACELPVELFDERFTTRMARSSIVAGARSDEDSLAAAHLLEAYLENRARSTAHGGETDESR